jgi:hypothetical protein
MVWMSEQMFMFGFLRILCRKEQSLLYGLSEDTIHNSGRAVAYLLRHYTTNRQVAGSIPDGVIGIFQ